MRTEADRTQYIRPENCTWLQGIGWHQGKPAKELRPGDVAVKNCGFREPIVAVAPSPSGKTINVTFEWVETFTGEVKHTTQRIKASRIVAVTKECR